MKTIPDSDQALAMAFVDGDLAEPERAAFELRLSAEPDLAAHVEALLATDGLVRRHARPDAAIPARSRLRPVVLALAAAAAIVAVVAIAALLRQPERRPAMEIALRASFESATEWVAQEPSLADLRPPGLDELRAPGQPADADPRAFVASARAIELGALGASASETTAAFYSIPLRVAEPIDVVVTAFPALGAAQTVWPAAGESARLEAGEHVLPAPSFRLVEDARGARVEYERGFLVPIGAGRVTVVVATRAARASAIESALLAPSGSATEHATRLGAAGFETHTLVVTEP